MRDINSVLSAQAKRTIANTEQSVDALPPGYMKGFILQNRKGQLVVSTGIANIRSKRTVQNREYIISGDDFVAGENVPPGLFYSVYVSNSLNYKVDSIDPVADEKDFSFYHPTLYGYRYIGQFFMGPGGVYQQVISYDPTGFNSLNTNVIDSLLLAVKEYLYVGYRGSGTPGNPQNGDSFLYIDGDEIKVVERVSGSWVDKWRIGGALAGLVASLVFAAGACHPGYSLSDLEYFPANSFRLYNFENSYGDQYGNEDFGAAGSISVTTNYSKFGTYSLGPDSPFGLAAIAYNLQDLLVGGSFSMSLWVYIPSAESAWNDNYFIFLDGSAGDDTVAIAIKSDLTLRVFFRKGSDTIHNDVVNLQLKTDEFQMLSIIYNASDDILYVTVNSDYISLSGAGYSWSGSGYFQNDITLGYSSDYSAYIDELLFAPNVCSLNLMLQHYIHDTVWKTGISWADYNIWCADGGKIRFHDNLGYPALSPGHIITVEDRPSTWTVDGGATDTNWNTVDLAGIVPPGTTAVTIYGYTEITGASTEATRHVLFRPYGSSETDVTRCEYTPHPTSATGLRCQLEKKILISGDLKFQYQKGTSAIHLHISVKEFA